MVETIISRARSLLDSAEITSKYNDEFIVRHLIAPLTAEVMARLNMASDCPILLRHILNVVEGATMYQLPGFVGRVWRVANYEDGVMQWEIFPRGNYHWDQAGWRLEGNQIIFEPPAIASETYEVSYTPTGEMMPHYATDGALDAALTTLTLGAAVLGVVDPAVNAYAGQVLRVIPVAGPIEERVIQSHDANAGTVTIRLPFTHHGAGATRYEIVPAGSRILYDAIAIRCAIRMAAMKAVTIKKMQMITTEYTSALKTLRDTFGSMQGRMPEHWRRDTVDNVDNQFIVLG